jgi:hypothetical protein
MLFKGEHIVYAADVVKRIQLIFTGMFSIIYMFHGSITLDILQRENKKIQVFEKWNASISQISEEAMCSYRLKS